MSMVNMNCNTSWIVSCADVIRPMRHPQLALPLNLWYQSSATKQDRLGRMLQLGPSGTATILH